MQFSTVMKMASRAERGTRRPALTRRTTFRDLRRGALMLSPDFEEGEPGAPSLAHELQPGSDPACGQSDALQS